MFLWDRSFQAGIRQAQTLAHLRRSIITAMDTLKASDPDEWFALAAEFFSPTYSRFAAIEFHSSVIARAIKKNPELQQYPLDQVQDTWMDAVERYFYDHRPEVLAKLGKIVAVPFTARQSVDHFLAELT